MTATSPTTKESFVETLAGLRFDSVFNPYADACLDFDETDAPAIRRRNLATVLDAALEHGVDSLWIARDLGYRGGRRTGLALTDEMHLSAHAKLLGSGRLKRSTRGPAMAERTARVIWHALETIGKPVFLWNVFPLHPHAVGDPMTNRCHSRAERQACRPLLLWLLEHLRPRSVLAIGRDAQLALADLDIQALQVRHPSYGGQSEFLEGVFSHYGVPRPAEERTGQLF
ncbi:uracil-DNA glycosylase [Bradyrhizobium sp. USDA 4529]